MAHYIALAVLLHARGRGAGVRAGVAAEQDAHLAGDGFVGEPQRLGRIVVDVALELELVAGSELQESARRTVDAVSATGFIETESY